MSCFIAALRESELELDKVCVVSGIGCTGRVAGYIKLDSFHTTHGRPIPFATGLVGPVPGGSPTYRWWGSSLQVQRAVFKRERTTVPILARTSTGLLFP